MAEPSNLTGPHVLPEVFFRPTQQFELPPTALKASYSESFYQVASNYPLAKQEAHAAS
jgi:hypothetical protein